MVNVPGRSKGLAKASQPVVGKFHGLGLVCVGYGEQSPPEGRQISAKPRRIRGLLGDILAIHPIFSEISVIVTPTPLAGAVVVDPELLVDHRGYFARLWCEREFASHGLNPRLVQCSVSYNTAKGTLRGMHYQADPYPEAKFLRCTRGAVYDVIIDLRPGSHTYLRHFAVELSAANRRMLYVPEGFAHGFQTLEDHSEVIYQMSEFYRSDLSRGVRWNDPAFGIEWPDVEHRIIADRDATYPDYAPEARA